MSDDDAPQVSGAIDTSVPHSARVWNYWVGGKDNYEVDRAAGDEVLSVYPQQAEKARACRAFLIRTVRWLAAEAGIRQFLDVGTGLPTENNTHEVAQRVAPDARIVYVDNDPMVLTHARALLTSTPEGVTTYLDADVHDPGSILAQAAGTLDLDRPVALMLLGILGHVEDHTTARTIVRDLLAGLPPGSYLVEYDGTSTSPEYVEALRRYADAGGVPYNLRTPDQIRAYYEGLDLVPPGVVPIPTWRPDPTPFGGPRDVDQWGGVGRKP
ncbi:SAM-dependent methyltransferase [Streptomyces sp. 184]|uniref:SAM-dependent methyltransferase n=1 Tax=Streptomyces sp. 184 TaxID=1827526 RepID=UPI003891EDB8